MGHQSFAGQAAQVCVRALVYGLLRGDRRTDASLDVWSTIQIYRRLVGYAEMSGIDFDMRSLVKEKTPAAPQPKAGPSTQPDGARKLAGRHLRCIEATWPYFVQSVLS